MATITVGTWTVAPALNLIERDGVSIKLEPRVMDLLVYFANAGDRVVSADELLRDVWQGRVFDDGIVYKKINQLRKALGDEPHTPRFIETIPKRGYRLVAAVRLAATDEASPSVGRSDDAEQASAAPAIQPRRRWFFWAAGGFGTAILTAALLGWRGPDPEPTPEPRLRYTPLSFEDAAAGIGPVAVLFVTWSPDSKAIAYTAGQMIPGGLQMYVRYLDSPAPRRLTQQFDGGRTYAWTTKERILFGTRGPNWFSESAGLWSVSALGGEPEQVFGVPAGTTNLITITRDESTVAALHRDEDKVWGIWAGELSSGTLQRYEPAPFESTVLANPPSLAFSPDGHKLLLMCWNPASEQAWLIPYPPDPTRPPRRILRELPTFNGTPEFSWMPDSRHIVVSTSGPGRPKSLYIADTESEEFRLLDGAGTANFVAPVVAPDGTKLIVKEVYNNLDIVTLDLNTAAVKPLIRTNRAEEMPAWATRDPALVYVTDQNGGPEIWFRESDRPERPVVRARDFTSGVTWVFMSPDLSPKLDRVAYLRVEADARGGAVSSHLWMSSLAGGPPIRLTSDAERIEQPGSWSPDGKWFVYTVVEADDSRTLRRVGRLGLADSEILASGLAESDVIPIYSPDGRWILYGDMGLKLVPADGGAPRELGLRNTVCAFARQPELLHCITYNAPSRALVNVDFTGRIVREVGAVAPENRPQTAVGWGFRLTLTPDGTGVSYSVGNSNIQLLLAEGLDTVTLP